MSPLPTLSISVVSHAQGELVARVLRDLEGCTAVPLEVVLTVNVPEVLPFDPRAFTYPVTVIENRTPKGFGANHNAAFAAARGAFFCVMNPDIRIAADPFPPLLAELRRPGIAAVAPAIVSPTGTPEDSARRFPTLLSIIAKALTGARGNAEYLDRREPYAPEWIAGMFMLFPREVFAAIAGFDERYHLYYEDVDLCARLRRRGYAVLVVPSVSAVHDARRASRRSLRHLSWHVQSLARFLLTTGRSASRPGPSAVKPNGRTHE